MFTIGEIARRAVVRPTTLRYYEQIGLLPAPRRVSGQRRYDESIFQRLTLIKSAQAAGFTLAEIRTLMRDFSGSQTASAGWRDMIALKLDEIRAMIARAEVMQQRLEQALLCSCKTLGECPAFGTAK
jgi:MerR family redox-sensitive transcriptional activator SoxR